MTDYEKNKIKELQNEGMGYRAIALNLNLPENTVKSFIFRSRRESTCKNCGSAIKQTTHRKKKEFCSDTCRMKWWTKHSKEVNRTMHKHICKNCNKSFETPYITSIYCSRKCYAEARKKVQE